VDAGGQGYPDRNDSDVTEHTVEHVTATRLRRGHGVRMPAHPSRGPRLRRHLPAGPEDFGVRVESSGELSPLRPCTPSPDADLHTSVDPVVAPVTHIQSVVQLSFSGLGKLLGRDGRPHQWTITTPR
jgi:hypothetical protein